MKKRNSLATIMLLSMILGSVSMSCNKNMSKQELELIFVHDNGYNTNLPAEISDLSVPSISKCDKIVLHKGSKENSLAKLVRLDDLEKSIDISRPNSNILTLETDADINNYKAEISNYLKSYQLDNEYAHNYINNAGQDLLNKITEAKNKFANQQSKIFLLAPNTNLFNFNGVPIYSNSSDLTTAILNQICVEEFKQIVVIHTIKPLSSNDVDEFYAKNKIEPKATPTVMQNEPSTLPTQNNVAQVERTNTTEKNTIQKTETNVIPIVKKTSNETNTTANTIIAPKETANKATATTNSPEKAVTILPSSQSVNKVKETPVVTNTIVNISKKTEVKPAAAVQKTNTTSVKPSIESTDDVDIITTETETKIVVKKKPENNLKLKETNQLRNNSTDKSAIQVKDSKNKIILKPTEQDIDTRKTKQPTEPLEGIWNRDVAEVKNNNKINSNDIKKKSKN